MGVAYGSGFSNGGAALRWLAVVWVAAAISGHYRFGLIAANQQRREMLTSAIGSILALVLIPLAYSLSGIKGAAAALGFAEVIVLASSWIFARRYLFTDALHRPAINEGCLEQLGEVAR
jgi:O-antigen/teichoic acid export membrane protein